MQFRNNLLKEFEKRLKNIEKETFNRVEQKVDFEINTLKRETMEKLNKYFFNLIKFRRWLVDSVQAAKRKNLPDLRNRKFTLNKFDEIFGSKK